MELTKEIKKLLVDKEINATQLAEKIGMTQSNLSKKMASGTYSVADLEKIAEALDMQIEILFKKTDN
ncbi:helix-turn-helix domain-containing protein [Psychrobacillus sp. FSL H8-0510]|uniref:helix-turn-helix domain-containing protein n=1 Tax=Psychrobacillus sp. FSL H8-0510 TaxID=2921394 RepID=UPI0030F60073